MENQIPSQIGNAATVHNNFGTIYFGGSIDVALAQNNSSSAHNIQSTRESTDDSDSWWNKYVGNDLSQTWIGSTFNTYFGSNRTHITNGARDDIIVILNSSQYVIPEFLISMDELTKKFEALGTKGYQTAVLRPGKTGRFERNNRIDHLTILLKQCNGQYMKTAALDVYANMSYRVDIGGIPLREKYE